MYICVFFVCVFLSLRSSLTDSLFEMTSWATLSYYSVIFIIPFLSRDHRKTSSSFFDWCALLFKRIVIFREKLYCFLQSDLRDRHIFVWQSLDVLNILNALTLKHLFRKTKTFLEKLENRFLAESTNIESALFLCKSALSVKNGPVATNAVLPLTTFFFFINFSIRTSYKYLIWCTNLPSAHIGNFRKLFCLIWKCVYLWVSLTKTFFFFKKAVLKSFIVFTGNQLC